MDTTMGNVYYNGSNPSTHLVQRSSTTATSTGLFDENKFNKTFYYDVPVSVEDVNKAIDKAIKNDVCAKPYALFDPEKAIGGSKSSIKDLTVNSSNYFEEDERILYIATRSAKILPGIEKVIFNPPATVVIWQDGAKTVVKCGEGEEFCEETGLAMAIARRYSGNRSRFLKMVRGAKHPEERE